ncbi:MAG TPA: hypothetical protein VKU00_01250 [Chthonomonadaceae bacterium]|nr:hypothetical protein [Chthonomonadaceae bacterium]
MYPYFLETIFFGPGGRFFDTVFLGGPVYAYVVRLDGSKIGGAQQPHGENKQKRANPGRDQELYLLGEQINLP